MDRPISNWDIWVEEAVSKLESLKKPSLSPINHRNVSSNSPAPELFEGLRQWDRESVKVRISDLTFQKWLNDIPSCGETAINASGDSQPDKELLLFSGNDYLGLSSHPSIKKALICSKAVQEGPKSSPIGYQDNPGLLGAGNYVALLAANLAALKKKEDSLICSTELEANMAVMKAIGSAGSLSADKVAVFCDALSNANIIDGLHAAAEHLEVNKYRHCDMDHLKTLLLECTVAKKVVVTDSIFSMDGHFAPIDELAELRKKHGFLLVIDDSHGTFVCGKHGGGVAEMQNCEKDVDICVSSMAAVGYGAFIACSKTWKQLILSQGFSFESSTFYLPIIAAAHAGVLVAEKEMWRRTAIWERVEDFRKFTGLQVTSYVISFVIRSEETPLRAKRHLLESGFHVTLPPNSCRLMLSLSAAHTTDDIKKLAIALKPFINPNDNNSDLLAKL